MSRRRATGLFFALLKDPSMAFCAFIPVSPKRPQMMCHPSLWGHSGHGGACKPMPLQEIQQLGTTVMTSPSGAGLRHPAKVRCSPYHLRVANPRFLGSAEIPDHLSTSVIDNSEKHLTWLVGKISPALENPRITFFYWSSRHGSTISFRTMKLSSWMSFIQKTLPSQRSGDCLHLS